MFYLTLPPHWLLSNKGKRTSRHLIASSRRKISHLTNPDQASSIYCSGIVALPYPLFFYSRDTGWVSGLKLDSRGGQLPQTRLTPVRGRQDGSGGDNSWQSTVLCIVQCLPIRSLLSPLSQALHFLDGVNH